MRHLALLLLALTACKKSAPGPVENTTVDPPPVATKAEEVTPALISALADGTMSPRGLVDPKRGVIEISEMKEGVHERRCGRDAERAIVEIAQAMKSAEVDGQEYEEYVITCAEDEERGGIWCISSGAGEWAPNYELLFLIDAVGAAHLAGILVWENGGNPEDDYEELTSESQDSTTPCADADRTN